MKRIILAAGFAALFAVVTRPILYGQATLNIPTLSAAVAIGDQNITLSSVSGISVGDTLFVDAEAMSVRALPSSGTRITVSRALGGTLATAHASGAQTWVGKPNYFHFNDPPFGPCTAAAQVANLWINVSNANVWKCSNSAWLGANSRRIVYNSTMTS